MSSIDATVPLLRPAVFERGALGTVTIDESGVIFCVIGQRENVG